MRLHGVRNAQMRGLPKATLMHSKVVLSVVELLEAQGYIDGFKVVDRNISVILRYDDELNPAIREIKRISKPSLRIYKSCKDIKDFMNGLGIYVVSTTQGLMTNAQARSKNLGGELLISVF